MLADRGALRGRGNFCFYPCPILRCTRLRKRPLRLGAFTTSHKIGSNPLSKSALYRYVAQRLSFENGERCRRAPANRSKAYPLTCMRPSPAHEPHLCPHTVNAYRRTGFILSSCRGIVGQSVPLQRRLLAYRDHRDTRQGPLPSSS